MSAKEKLCGNFQANIFQKSKCQNCFQPRECHLLDDEDLGQAKPIYGGWLLLAPEGSRFDNPCHRTRKWQRRFFILFEHGFLRYALDEMPSTLPQGTIDMNRCSDVTDAESRTARKNSLCIVTPEEEHFLRAECQETIDGWRQALSVYPRSNKQKKKRKVEPPAQQEPGPAKVTVTSGGDGIPRLPMGRPTWWQEEKRRSRAASFLCQADSASAAADDGGAMSTGRKARVESESRPSPKAAQNSRPPRRLSPTYASRAKAPMSAHPASPGTLACPGDRAIAPDRRPDRETPSREAGGGGAASATRGGAGAACAVTSRRAFAWEQKPRDPRARTQSPGREEVARLFGEERRRWRVIGRFEESPNAGPTDTSGCSQPPSDGDDARRRGRRDERRDLYGRCDAPSDAGKERRVPDANLPRAKSLDGAVTESAVTPDLLNVKKGWMTKLDDDGTWKKHWFVLTDQRLRYYKDSLAEEASDADGEIDLSACYDVQEFPVPRNYGFRILGGGGACTLSAMTSGIRRNWIQAIAKNAPAAVAPDVTRSAPEVNPEGRVQPEPSPRPEPPGNETPAPPSEPRKSGLGERAREGRSKTFHRSPFQMDKERADAVDRSPPLCVAASRRSSPSSSSPSPVPASPTEDDVSRPPNTLLPKSPARPSSLESPERGRMPVDVEGETRSAASGAKEEEMERRWLQVETTPLREEKQVAISAFSENADADGAPAQQLAALLHKELGQKQKVLEQLQRQNSVLQEQLEDALAREQRGRRGYVLQATCERGFAAMEETHHKVVEDLQRQHQREISKLTEERERLLAEETAATVAAIEAMKNAHKEELEKKRRSQLGGLHADIDQRRLQYREELRSIQRELEVLSEQYSQKCLENAHLAQALEAERQALGRCRRENRELHAHNQESNGRLSAEIARMRSCLSGETAPSPATPGKDVYELEVLLRVKESEIQYLKREIHSLKDELQSALRDKKYAADKHKDVYAELSVAKAEADCHVGKLKEKLHIATRASGDRTVWSAYDIMKSKSNPDFTKKEETTTSEPSRSVESKSLKEGLTVQERMKPFQAKESEKI